MKKLFITLCILSTQTLMAHPDCVFNNAPVGSGISKKVGEKSDNAIISKTIAAKEKLDELINLFNRNRARSISVLAALEGEHSLEKPLIYSPKTIAQDLAKLQSQMSPELKRVIFENGRIDLNRISEIDIRRHGGKLAGLYELAIRYELLIKRKSVYVEQSHKDVRGFNYLYGSKINEKTLNNFSSYSSSQQETVKEALMGICRNNKVKIAKCKKELNTSIRRNTLGAYYTKYINTAVTNWNSFFQIPARGVRSDVRYVNGVLELPFKRPETRAQEDFVRTIETYWKTPGLAVYLDFQDVENIPNLILKENSVAHVNKLGGNDIIMNSTINMNAKGTQATLNHEFGHVLGLPDCYIEFFDEEQDAFVNYQLFKSDMMCSASGKLTPRIIEELKRVYSR